jgi:hypothetical protein
LCLARLCPLFTVQARDLSFAFAPPGCLLVRDEAAVADPHGLQFTCSNFRPNLALGNAVLGCELAYRTRLSAEWGLLFHLITSATTTSRLDLSDV